jgi:cyclic pyranopterin phosphate synthase
MSREDRMMTTDEIERLAKIMADLGIVKVKLTGGEPLMREDVVDVVARLSKHFDEVSMTTNGLRLRELAFPLREAGLTRVNVSLNTLRPERYRRIYGVDLLDDSLAGLDSAISAGLYPIKLNMVVLRGINDDEIPDMMRFTAEKGLILQMIELEAEKEEISSQFFTNHHLDLSSIRRWLQSLGQRNGENPLHNRERFIIDNLMDGTSLPAPAKVELVMPLHNTDFCANCTRIRLTAGGFIKGCLFDKTCLKDVLGPLRKGATPREVEELILGVVMEREPYWLD